MLSLDVQLRRAALNYGKWQKKAKESQTMKDRIRFVHAETKLGMAAQAVFEKEQKREARGRNKG